MIGFFFHSLPRALGALVRVKERAPIYGAQFAAWGVCFATFDCSFMYLRQKEDPWNSVMSGAATGFVLAARSQLLLVSLSLSQQLFLNCHYFMILFYFQISGGPKHMIGNAVVGAVLLGMIEGIGIMFNRMGSESFRPVDPREAPQDPPALGPSAN